MYIFNCLVICGGLGHSPSPCVTHTRLATGLTTSSKTIQQREQQQTARKSSTLDYDIPATQVSKTIKYISYMFRVLCLQSSVGKMMLGNGFKLRLEFGFYRFTWAKEAAAAISKQFWSAQNSGVFSSPSFCSLSLIALYPTCYWYENRMKCYLRMFISFQVIISLDSSYMEHWIIISELNNSLCINWQL